VSDKNVTDLYELLPALYRLRDAERGYPLQAALEIISAQADVIKQDIDGLWDDFFIETCADWVIPYIGDLVGNNPLHEVAVGPRADAAKAIYYRRRKATLPMLEELAQDVTGWGAHAVAFFELLGWTQNLNHLRDQAAPIHDARDPGVFDRVGTVNLRNTDALDLLNGPFDVVCHTVDVRPISRAEGWYNLPKVGFFLWRLRHYPLTGVTPRQASVTHGYHFSTLGNPASLFNNPEPEADPTGLASEIHVPGPIRPVAFHFSPGDYYGPGRSFTIYRGPQVDPDQLVPLSEIMCKDLGAWEEPPSNKVAVDVRLGRFAFASGEAPDEVTVAYNYGFSADIGGGPYLRQQPAPQPDQPAPIGPDTVADPEALDLLISVPSSGRDTIGDALVAWDRATHPTKSVIQIEDNRAYEEDLTINMVAGDELVIQAGNQRRPTLIGTVTITGGGQDTRLALDGLLISGRLHLQGSLEELSIAHCTLVPGRRLDEDGRPLEPESPSVIVDAGNDRLRLEIDHSIVGPLRLPVEVAALKVRDSIIDSPAEGNPARLVPTLISGDLSTFPALGSASPAVNVTIGDVGPRTAVFSGVPATLAEARDLLQEAIRGSHPGRAFTGARVISADNCLAVLPGVVGAVTVEAAGTDRTATELRLDRTAASRAYTLITGALPPTLSMSSAAPAINVTIGDEGPHTAVFSDVPTTPAEARDRLQAAIRDAHDSPAFKDALVGSTEDDRLVVLPGTSGAAVTFGGASADQTTLTELALRSDRPAIAGNDGGDLPGPPATLERTTVFGAVHLEEVVLASGVIFASRVVARRRQAGCVRFGYVPEGSQTPRRYRCQPDLALEEVDDPAQRESARARLTPSFTSVRYGHPAYAQLGLGCAGEISTGAEDGSEMGAFGSLQQPRREANLRLRLEEYLPFGLEAGLIYVT
jgi:hypothetical protein